MRSFVKPHCQALGQTPHFQTFATGAMIFPPEGKAVSVTTNGNGASTFLMMDALFLAFTLGVENQYEDFLGPAGRRTHLGVERTYHCVAAGPADCEMLVGRRVKRIKRSGAVARFGGLSQRFVEDVGRGF
jgi:hypothetical protein